MGMDMAARAMAKGAEQKAVKQGSTKLAAADKRIFSLPNAADGALSVEGVKGKTVQNFFGTNLRLNDVLPFVVNVIDNQFFDIPSVPDRASLLFSYRKPPIKDNTQYTVVVNVVSNTLSDSAALRLIRAESYGNAGLGLFLPKDFKTGLFVSTFTTDKSKANNWDGNSNVFLSTPGITGGIRFSMMILEGDWTNKEVPPYFEGIKSVGEDIGKLTVKSGTRNIVDFSKIFIAETIKEYRKNPEKGGVYLTTSPTVGASRVRIPLDLKPFRTYTFSCKANVNRLDGKPVIQVRNASIGTYAHVAEIAFVANQNKNISVTFTTDDKVLNNTFDLWLYPKTSSDFTEEVTATYEDIQIEEGSIVNPFTVFKTSQIEIPLTEPLRSLPNGVSDEIKDGKIIRRVGKVVLNGSENWHMNGSNQGYGLEFPGIGGPATSGGMLSSVISEKLTTVIQANIFSGTAKNAIAAIGGDTQKLYIRIDETLTTVALLKQWLSTNNVTAYYQLATPTETPITIPAINSFTNGMVTVENNIWPNELTVSYSTNVVARVISAESTLSGVLASTLTLADKELAMKSLTTLATGATLTDAVNKVNQILNIWR